MLFLIYAAIKPPFCGPDEFVHFYRAYQISEGTFTPERSEGRIGGSLPVCLKEAHDHYFPYTYLNDLTVDKGSFLYLFHIPATTQNRVFVDFPNTATYSPISYLLQAGVICIVRCLHGSLGMAYYGSRLLVFIIYLWLMMAAIRRMPVFKWHAAIFLLLPTSVYLLNSFSVDPINTLLCFVFTSFFLEDYFKKEIINPKRRLAYLFTLLLLSQVKYVFVVMGWLLVLLQPSQFGGSKRKWVMIASGFLLCLLSILFSTKKVESVVIPYEQYNHLYREGSYTNPGVNFDEQKNYLQSHPSIIPSLLLESVRLHGTFYLQSLVCGLGTYMELLVSENATFLIVIGLLLSLVFSKEPYVPDVRLRLFAIGLFLIIGVLILISQYLLWTEVKHIVINGVQGRYFMAILPLLAIGIGGWGQRLTLPPLVVGLPLLLLSNGIGINLLYTRYATESIKLMESFGTDFEASIPLTSSTSMVSKANGTVVNEPGTSNHCIAVAPNSKAMVLPFKNLQHRDLVLLKAVVKGRGGQLVVLAKNDSCGNIYDACTVKYFTSSERWYRLQLRVEMPDCLPNEGAIFLFNTTDSILYFDEVQYQFKRPKH